MRNKVTISEVGNPNMDIFARIIERVKDRAAARAILIEEVVSIITCEMQAREPVAWMTSNDWGSEPLVTSTQSVVDAWRSDNRRVTPLFE